MKIYEDTNIAGHLPIEISRASSFMVQLISKNYRRSPVIQGGLEIPAKVIVTMPGAG